MRLVTREVGTLPGDRKASSPSPEGIHHQHSFPNAEVWRDAQGEDQTRSGEADAVCVGVCPAASKLKIIRREESRSTSEKNAKGKEAIAQGYLSLE